jgi:hypothetical protein
MKEVSFMPMVPIKYIAYVLIIIVVMGSILLCCGLLPPEPPFRACIHCTWRNNGLATYLLCMLIKQHTGVTANIDQSILSLQASPLNYETALHFYKKVGFSQHIDPDNGLSQTSKHFQKEVMKCQHYWISNQPFLLLKRGLIILPKWKRVQQEKDVFLRFPWPASSMKKIENCVKNRPMFHCLSFMPLLDTGCPLSYVMSMSTPYGYIKNDYWQKKASLPGHWLNEMEVKLLLSAFFLRNTAAEHKSVHVISPDLTCHMKTFFEVTQRIAKKEKQEKDEEKYKFYIQYFAQYVDTVRDLFEHKF